MSLEAQLIDLILIFALAAAVGVIVEKFVDFPYTIALLVTGIFISFTDFSIGIQLSHDVILFALLPPLLLEGAATTDFESFKKDGFQIGLIATVGLVVSVAILGVATNAILGLPMMISLLFAAIILPTDPVSVLALFEEVGAPERLSVLVEGESLINDGVGVVLFATLLELVLNDVTIDQLLTPANFIKISSQIGVSIIGGIIIGGVLGYAVYSVMINLDEHKTETVLTLLLTYSSFLIAEHYFHVSGVVATVAAGLFLGNRGAEHAMSAQTKISIFNTLDTAAFLVNTFIFIAIGITTPVSEIIDNSEVLIPAIILVLLARAAVVYPLTGFTNLFQNRRVQLKEQHIIVWGGLHASIPIALVLGLPPSVPYYSKIKVMVFGVAAFSLIVQGLTMRPLIERLGIITKSEEEELYELLIGRARAIDSVLESDRLSQSVLSSEVYERFKEEYKKEKKEINRAISQLLSEYPELQNREGQIFERQLLMKEKSGIKGAELEGRIPSDVADELQNEIDIKIDKVNSGETTVQSGEEGYREFWKNEVENVLGEGVYKEETESETEDSS